MDSLTQIALGAACGEAVAGWRVGGRAALWGGVAGTLPDLDILAYPFLDPMGELYFHRGLTHGLLFGFVAGPFLGWLLARFYRWRLGRAGPQAGEALHAATSWRLWAAVSVVALVTHPLIDALTIYGTQLFQPFSNTPVSVGSLFIIDPLYTTWLVLGVGIAVALRRDHPWRRRIVVVGLALSTAYAGWSLAAHAWARAAVGDVANAQHADGGRRLVAALPFTTLAWNVLVEVPPGRALHPGATLDGADDETVFVAQTYALADEPGTLDLTQGLVIPQRADLLAPAEGSRALETLRWFSQGWYAAEQRGDRLLVHDLRFGRIGGTATDAEAPFVFTFWLYQDAAGAWTFEQQPPDLGSLDAEAFRRLWGRIQGRTGASAQAP
ncbi:MAG: metal-dependent hydrolase [Bacteroidota bacterium]